jgi:predicted porin
VTIYGILDAGLSYVNHSGDSSGHHALLKYGDSVASASRWGIRGREDLGQGMSAIFTLENGMNVGTGMAAQGGALFGRQAFVGLSKTDVGTFTLGRQYVFSFDYLGHYFATGGTTAGAGYSWHINSLDQLNGGELNNALKFSSASFAGWRFGAMYGFSNQAGAFAGAPAANGQSGSSRGYSFGTLYQAGPFKAGFAWSFYGWPGSSTPAIPVAIANVNPGVLKALRTMGAGASYQVKSTTLYALWTNTMLTPPATAASHLNIYEAGFRSFLTPFLIGALGATYSDLAGGVEGRWKQINASLDYYLSKSTDIYALVDYQLASGQNHGVPVQAQLGNSTTYFGLSGAGANNQLALRIGVRVFF